MNKQEQLENDEGIALPAKVMQVMESRKVWAATIGLATTLVLWWLGEIDGARAIEAMTWVLGIFIGSVALEDGMTRLFSSLAQAVASQAAESPTLEGGKGISTKTE
jgi:hypothetical protein